MRDSKTAVLSHHSLLLLFTVIWGANFILAEIALEEMLPISFSVSRFVIGGAAMLLLLYFQCYADAKREGKPLKFFPPVDKRDWGRLMLVSVLGATLAPWIGIEGLGLTHGSRASIWLALGPVISTGCGVVLRTERIGTYGYAGILLAGGGTFIMALDGLQTGNSYWIGDVLLLIALIMAVAELHLIKPLARKYGSVSMVAMRTAIGGSLYLVIATPSLLGENWLNFGFWTWFAILAGGAIGVGVGQWIKVRALRSIGPTRVVIYGNLVPLAAMLIAWLSIGENPSLNEIIAGILIIAGAIFVQILDAFRPGQDNTSAGPSQ